MNGPLLVCGPYFVDGALASSLVIFICAKPLAYILYIRAFRYRVSAAIPMSSTRVAGLALQRMLIGIILIGGGTFVLALGLGDSEGSPNVLVGWTYLYGARIGAWWYVGRVGASIRGKRLIGWIVGGMFVNVAVDVAAVAGMLRGWVVSAATAAALLLFILVLESRGRRPAMLARFSEPICASCSYNLTGNLSGICPECGIQIDMATLAKIPVSTPDAASH